MLSAIVGAAAVGLLLGMSLRVSAVIAASAAITVVILSIAPFAGMRAATTVLTVFGSLFAVQFGYMAGLALSCVWSRVRNAPLEVRENALSIGR